MQHFSQKAAASDVQSDPRVARVLEILRAGAKATTEEQIRITEIPRRRLRKAFALLT